MRNQQLLEAAPSGDSSPLMTECAAGRWSPEVQRCIVSSVSRAEAKILQFDVRPERDVVPVMKQWVLGRGFMVERQTSCGKYSVCEKCVS